MNLKIITPHKTLLDEPVDSVTATTLDGEIGVLPNHIPLVSPLDIGVLKFVQNGQTKKVAVMGGVFSTDGKVTTVLSDAAELSDEIDVARAQHAKERAEARLREKAASVDVKRAELSLAKALVRLKLNR
jgi:F-type H+-transporting ATPase subunit epsilon